MLLRSVQLTLDGDRQLHDRNRISVSGKRTFDATIAAIRQLIVLKAHVSLRVHIHQERLESTRNLIDYLEKEKILGHPQVAVYFSPMNTFGSEKISASRSSRIFGRCSRM